MTMLTMTVMLPMRMLFKVAGDAHCCDHRHGQGVGPAVPHRWSWRARSTVKTAMP